jgi:hypothetical protein
MSQKPSITPMSWDDFRRCGLLWATNRALHLFGVAIVMDVDEDGRVMNAYPARVVFRGFTLEDEDVGFKAVHSWLLGEMPSIKFETES